MREWTILMGLEAKICLDTQFRMMYAYPNIKAFFNFAGRKGCYDYVILTPFNKGNLNKIHCYINHYDFYYGTEKLFYSTTLSPIKDLKP